MADIITEKFVEVSATSTVTEDYVVPNGETLQVDRIMLEAGASPDTQAAVIWDEGGGSEKILHCTHASSDISDFTFELVGDGVKILRIKLINDQLTADMLGGRWRGRFK